MACDIRYMSTTPSFLISDLVERFEFYATNLKAIKHDPTKPTTNRFVHFDLENLSEALTTGLSFPALMVQTPEAEKSGNNDNLSEAHEFTFIVIFPKESIKSMALSKAKRVTDAIFNRLLLDVLNEIIPGTIQGTSEGIFGPTADQMYGWAVNIAIADGYNGEVDPNDWEDIA